MLQRSAIVLLTAGCARIVGSQEFGRFALAYALCVNIGAIVSDSLGATASVYVTRNFLQSEANGVLFTARLIRASFLVALLLAVIVLTTSSQLSRAVGHPEMRYLYSITALILVFQIPSSVMNVCLYALDQAKGVALGASIIATFSVIAGLSAAYVYGAAGLLYALATSAGLGCVVYYRLMTEPIRTELTSPKTLLAFAGLPIRDFTFPTAVAILFTTPVHLLCLNMLAAAQDGLHQTAVFAACYLICMLFIFVPGALASLIVPLFVRVQSQGSGLVRFGSLTIFFIGAVGAIMFVVVATTASQIVLLFGDNFRDGATTLRLLAGVGVLSAVLITISQLMLATEKAKTNRNIALGYATAYVSLTYYFVVKMHLGSEGLASALLIAQAIQLCAYAGMYIRVAISAQKVER